MKTYGQCLREGEKTLWERKIDNACGDAWALFSFITGWERIDYITEQDRQMPREQQLAYEKVIARRGSHEPLQYITGVQNFYGYDFQVNAGVLIPRFDTEVLIEKILELKPAPARILDLCTGSGCIAITLAKELQLSFCAAVDLSEKALDTAQQNAERLGAAVTFCRGDLFQPVKNRQWRDFDLIVSNPPYIPSARCESLMEEVKDHEPRMALDGKEDGLFFYRRIIAEAPEYLKKDGHLFLEIGYDQGEPVRQLLQAHGFRETGIEQDLAGLDRVAWGSGI